MKTPIVLFIGLMLAGSFAHADSWVLKPEKKDTEFGFGDSRIVLHYDSTQNTSYPKHAMSVYLEGKLVARHEDIGFEQIFSSPDHDYFLGVSNRGLVRPAYVIFDRHGKILKKEPHGSKNIHYTQMSVTLIRLWYDKDNPEVRFFVADGRLQNVYVNSSDGDPLSLMIPEDLSLRMFLLENLLDKSAKPKENCYVSFAKHIDPKTRSVTRLDPPKGFLKGFENRPYMVKPVSAHPKTKDRSLHRETNPATGIPDGIYTVEILDWLGKNTARVKTEMWRGGLWARGSTLIVEKRDGKWHIKKRLRSWKA